MILIKVSLVSLWCLISWYQGSVHNHDNVNYHVEHCWERDKSWEVPYMSQCPSNDLTITVSQLAITNHGMFIQLKSAEYRQSALFCLYFFCLLGLKLEKNILELVLIILFTVWIYPSPVTSAYFCWMQLAFLGILVGTIDSLGNYLSSTV